MLNFLPQARRQPSQQVRRLHYHPHPVRLGCPAGCLMHSYISPRTHIQIQFPRHHRYPAKTPHYLAARRRPIFLNRVMLFQVLFQSVRFKNTLHLLQLASPIGLLPHPDMPQYLVVHRMLIFQAQPSGTDRGALSVLHLAALASGEVSA